jgi:CBS domain-containing protein
MMSHNMDIASVMTRNVEVISPESSLQEAAAKMRDLDVGSLPVCDGRKLQGIITDRDVTVRAVAEGRNPAETKVNDIMTTDIVFATEDQAIEEAAEMMSSHQIRRLPIVDSNRDLVGIVALGDLAVDHGDDQLSGEVLQDVSTPSRPKR